MLKKLMILGILLIACQSYAQIDPDDDGIGLYFDPSALVNCVSRDVGPAYGWLVITHPTSPVGVGSWEAKVDIVGPAFFSNTVLFGNGIDFAPAATEYLVGISEPLVNIYTYPAVVVAEFEIYIMDTAAPVEIYVDGIFQHSLPERVPAYLDGAEYPNYETIKELRQSTGGPDIPVATINGECAVSSDETTWDGIKSMFR